MAALHWGREPLPAGPFDWVIGSDVTWGSDDEAHDGLSSTLAALLRRDAGARCVLASASSACRRRSSRAAARRRAAVSSASAATAAAAARATGSRELRLADDAITTKNHVTVGICARALSMRRYVAICRPEDVKRARRGVLLARFWSFLWLRPAWG